MAKNLSSVQTKKARLKALYQKIESQVDKLPLAQQPNDIVPGEGDPKAEVMMIGEAPGREEARQRRPFVGASGKLLRQVLKKININPGDVFINNIVKVRPPHNRDPLPREIKAFKPFVDQEIKIVNPKLIVTLGRFSMAKFLPAVKISQVHGRLHRVKWKGKIKYVLPMYHPAAALYSSRVKECFVTDFQKLPKVLRWVKRQQANQRLKTQVEQILL